MSFPPLELTFYDPAGELFEPPKKNSENYNEKRKDLFKKMTSKYCDGILVLLDLRRPATELEEIWRLSIESFMQYIRDNHHGDMLVNNSLKPRTAVVFTKADLLPWFQLHRQRSGADSWVEKHEGLKSLASDIRRMCRNVRFFFCSAVGWNQGRPNERIAVLPKQLSVKDTLNTLSQKELETGDLIPDRAVARTGSNGFGGTRLGRPTLPLFVDPMQVVNEEEARPLFDEGAPPLFVDPRGRERREGSQTAVLWRARPVADARPQATNHRPRQVPDAVERRRAIAVGRLGGRSAAAGHFGGRRPGDQVLRGATVDTAFVITFGAVALAAGLALAWSSLHPHVAPYLALRDIVLNWWNLLGQGPGQMLLVLNADALGFQTLVKHFPGWYWTAEGLVMGSAGRVYVYPDFIARLGYDDHWQGSRFLDASAFCLRVGEMGDAPPPQYRDSGTPPAHSNGSTTFHGVRNLSWSVVDFLCRGVRWQLVLDDSSIRSRDGYVLNCYLAVHTAVELPLSDVERLNRLFDILPQFQQMLRSVITGALHYELSRRGYREAMYDVPAIVASLNRHWAEEPQFRHYHDLIKVYFTALVIRPRVEAEREFLTAGANLVNIKEMIRKLDRQVKESRDRRGRRWDDWVERTEIAIDALMGQAETQQNDNGSEPPPRGQVAASIKNAADGLQWQMPSIGNPEPLLKAVGALFQTGREQLETCTQAILELIKDLACFMEEIREDDEDLIRKIQAMRTPPADEGSRRSEDAALPAGSPETRIRTPAMSEVRPVNPL